MPWPQEDQHAAARRSAGNRAPPRGGHRPRRAVPRRAASHHAVAAATPVAVAVGEPAGAGGPPVTPAPASWRTWPLLAAGFVTAFGAHAIAANLGRYATGRHASLLELGVLLALYDGAEVLLKPAFGVLADRIGARPVLLGGLLGFAAASAAFVLAGEQDALAAARLAQGAAAAAFSPAASALIARFSPAARRGRAFGSYGAWKGLGYTTGPLLGGGLITLGGFPLLFTTLAAIGLGVAAWAAITLPAAPPQPRAGRAHDSGRLPAATGMAAGLALAAAGFAAAVVLPGLPGLLLAGVTVGTGTGLVTPLGFAALTAATPTSRLGQTMGTAEVGRELGDAGGPLLVGAIAGVAGLGLGIGLLGLAGTLLLTATATSWRRHAI